MDKRKKGKRSKNKKEKKKIKKMKQVAQQQDKQWKNENFGNYYTNQFTQFFPTKEKFEELISKLREKLPYVFRLSKAHPFHEGYQKNALR